MTNCINPIHPPRSGSFKRLGTNFCLSCLAERSIQVMEREREREIHKRVSTNHNTTNIKLINEYLDYNIKVSRPY